MPKGIRPVQETADGEMIVREDGADGAEGPPVQTPLANNPSSGASLLAVCRRAADYLRSLAPAGRARIPLQPSANDPALKVFRDAGLLNKDGSIRDGMVADYIRFFSLGGRFGGGPVAVIGQSGLVFATSKDEFDKTFPWPNDFLRARNLAAILGKNSPSDLVPLYHHFIEAAMQDMFDITSSFDAIHKIHCRTHNAISLLYATLETLRHEAAETIETLGRHMDTVRLEDAIACIVKHLGIDPALWDSAAASYVRRDEGFTLERGGVFTWNGSPKRPELNLPKGIKFAGKMPWQDHPLFQRGAQASAGDAASRNLNPGFNKVATHDGSGLFWRCQINPETKMSEIVIAGDLPMLAEMIQRLHGANGGTVFGDHNDFDMPHPLNKAIDRIRWYAAHRHDPICVHAFEFANGTYIAPRFNTATMMYELVYGRSSKHTCAWGVEKKPQPESHHIYPIWKTALEQYLADTSYEREFTLSAPPNLPAIAEAMHLIAGIVGARGMSTASSKMINASLNLPSDVRMGEAGVKIGRDGAVTTLVFRFYSRCPRRFWGSERAMERASNCTEVSIGHL